MSDKTSLDDWARLHVLWHEDEVLRAAAAQVPACMALWPILIALSKGKSHVERNPTGAIKRTIADLAHDACVDVDDVKRALDVLQEGEFLTYSPGRLGAVEIHLNRFGKWQSPRRSKGDRDDRSRNGPEGARAGKNHSNGDNVATGGRHGGDTVATPDRDGDVDRDVEKGESASASTVPSGPRSTDGQIRRARGQLGDLAFHVDMVIARRTTTPSATVQLRDFWIPACKLHTAYGRNVLLAAFGQGAKKDAFSMAFIEQACQHAAARNRPALALVGGAQLDQADLDALDATEGDDE